MICLISVVIDVANDMRVNLMYASCFLGVIPFSLGRALPYIHNVFRCNKRSTLTQGARMSKLQFSRSNFGGDLKKCQKIG